MKALRKISRELRVRLDAASAGASQESSSTRVSPGRPPLTTAGRPAKHVDVAAELALARAP